MTPIDLAWMAARGHITLLNTFEHAILDDCGVPQLDRQRLRVAHGPVVSYSLRELAAVLFGAQP